MLCVRAAMFTEFRNNRATVAGGAFYADGQLLLDYVLVTMNFGTLLAVLAADSLP